MCCVSSCDEHSESRNSTGGQYNALAVAGVGVTAVPHNRTAPQLRQQGVNVLLSLMWGCSFNCWLCFTNCLANRIVESVM